MRISILLTAAGAYVNPQQSLINYSPVDGSAASSLFFNQITVEFYNSIVENPNGIYTPVSASVIKTSLTGTIQLKVYPSANAPYAVDLASDTINIANSCMLQWTGITEALDIICTSISGAAYINVLLDRQ